MTCNADLFSDDFIDGIGNVIQVMLIQPRHHHPPTWRKVDVMLSNQLPALVLAERGKGEQALLLEDAVPLSRSPLGR